MVCSFPAINSAASLEHEYRFCLSPRDWLMLSDYFKVSNFSTMMDETWLVSENPIKIARIRNGSKVCYKTVLSKSQSLEEDLDIPAEEARKLFDEQYEKDLTILKLRGSFQIKDLIITLDLVDEIGHCIEIEGNDLYLKQAVLFCLELDPFKSMKGYGFYLRSEDNPPLVSICLDHLHLIKELQ